MDTAIHTEKETWGTYQKHVADDNYYYARSCIRQNFFPASEYMFLHILRKVLGKHVYDDPNHTTCTGIGYHSDIVPFETIQTVVARHFALMTEAGLENIAISCVTSFGIYTEILETWQHFPEQLEKTREFLYKATKREFNLPKNIAHTSDIIYKFRHEIAEKAVYKLVHAQTGEPLNVVEHIGCHYAKMFPTKGIGGAEFPQVLSGMITAWGGKVIDYPERRHCCGFGFRNYLVQANRGYSVSNTYKKLESMQPYNPDFILTNCPGCAMFIDKWQYTIAEMEQKTFDSQGKGIPVLTYEELAALVLGIQPWDVGLQIHQIQSESLLDALGIPYDTALKYVDKQGNQLPLPNKPNNLLQ
ncbi:MAG TPA: heterodisulfide reductase-related iron-sulfur binding cluster [Bacteroidales bacterium]|jgi:heterodisulfide reductase subunit B|nr:heterodisulfide reductase-related iron-sulfur binding cluster [Bacteroidales bacterium]